MWQAPPSDLPRTHAGVTPESSGGRTGLLRGTDKKGSGADKGSGVKRKNDFPVRAGRVPFRFPVVRIGFRAASIQKRPARGGWRVEWIRCRAVTFPGRATTFPTRGRILGRGATFLGLRTAVVGLRATFLGVRTTFVSLRVTFLGLRAMFVSLRVAFLGLRMAFVRLRVTVVGLRTTILGLRMTFVGLRMTFASLRVTIVNQRMSVTGRTRGCWGRAGGGGGAAAAADSGVLFDRGFLPMWPSILSCLASDDARRGGSLAKPRR
jgi:hypothetical protein